MITNILRNKNIFTFCYDGGRCVEFYESESSDEELKEIFDVNIENIADNFTCHRFYRDVDFFDVRYIGFCINNGKGQIMVSYTIDPMHWDYPFSLIDLAEYLVGASTEEITISHCFDDEQFDVSFQLDIDVGCVNDVLDSFKLKAKQIYVESFSKLTRPSSDNFLTKIFNFPSEYRTSCCQYLMWFGDFLCKLGIKADISTNNVNGQTALSIIPEGKDDLLSEIECLFYKYLSLPYSEFMPLSRDERDLSSAIAYQALVAQVGYFKSQIALIDAQIQLKDATLGVYTNQINEQKLLIDKLQGGNEIKIWNGSVRIGDFKWLGVTVSPKKLIENIISKK